MKRRGWLVSIVGAFAVAGALLAPAGPAAAATNEPSFLEAHPGLKDDVFTDSPSNFRIGFGAIPVGIMRGQYFTGLDAFQAGYLGSRLDWDILKVIFGWSFSQGEAGGRYAMLMTAPRFRISRSISIGLLAGYELLSIPGVKTVYNVKVDPVTGKAQFTTPPQPFETRGAIYGFSAAEYVKISDQTTLKISQLGFKETYSNNQSSNGLDYDYSPNGAGFNSSVVAPSTVFLIEVSLIF